MGQGDLIPPLALSPWWVIAGLGLLCVLGAWLIIALLIRFRGIAVPAGVQAIMPPPLAIEHEYLRKIDALESEWRSGRVSARHAAQSLGSLTREFTTESTGIVATHLTLVELRQRPRLRRLANTVTALYETEFAKAEPHDAAGAFVHSRKLVRSWF